MSSNSAYPCACVLKTVVDHQDIRYAFNRGDNKNSAHTHETDKSKTLRQWKIDLKDSPAPDWSLIQAKDYVNLTVQTSRGCPHNCDFCDVVQYLGREYRTKSVARILGEVKAAHGIGAHSVFFSDDNFLENKSFTKELLRGLIQWNTARARPLTFSTQITVHVADDEALLKMFADARFSVLFLLASFIDTKDIY